MSEFPKMLFHTDGSTLIVGSAEEEGKAAHRDYVADHTRFYAARAEKIRQSEERQRIEDEQSKLKDDLKPATAFQATQGLGRFLNSDPPPLKRRGRPPKIRTLETDNG